MTTLSRFEVDQADLLAKRFAALAASYFEQPENARAPSALVPLENLFRILQMFRFGSFADERRSGVLALRPLGEQPATNGLEGVWHKNIEVAVAASLEATFGQLPREQAVRQVQASLAWLVTAKDAPPADVLTRSKAFLERFSTALN